MAEAVVAGGAPDARRPGRPRASGRRDGVLAPRDEIVSVASRLFAEKGFAGTTMRDIAQAAGLKQSSLYYYFNRKELILEASFTVNTAPLQFIETLDGGSAGLRLYRFVAFDTRQLCLSPWDVNEVERLATRHADLFAGLWRDRRTLHGWVVGVIEEGVAAGQFVACDPELTALGVTSFNEGIQNWYRHQDSHRIGGPSPFAHPAYDVDVVAAFLARTALRLVLADPSELAVLERQAADPGPPRSRRRAVPYRGGSPW